MSRNMEKKISEMDILQDTDDILLSLPAILLVTCDASLGRQISDLLKSGGFSVTCCDCGLKALKTMDRTQFDMAIMDMELEDLNGIDLINKMKIRRPELAIVAITGNTSLNNAVSAINHGAQKYFLKPVQYDELKAVIEDLSEKFRIRSKEMMQVKRLKMLYKLLDSIGRTLNYSEIMERSIQNLIEIEDADAAAIFLVREIKSSDEKKLNFECGKGIDQSLFRKISETGLLRKFIEDKSINSLCVKIENTERNVYSIMEQAGLKRIVIVKIKGEEKETGIVLLGSRKKKVLEKADMELLRAMSTQVGMAVEKAGLYRLSQKACEELKTAREGLILAEKHSAVGRLAAGLAHEIGTPLNIISGRAEYLGEVLKKSDLKKFSEFKEIDHFFNGLEVIIQQIMRISHLLRQLMDFSREYKTIKEKVDVRDIIKETIPLLDLRLKKHKIEISSVFPKNIPSVQGNFHQLQQVFLNLLMNSIDAILADSDRRSKKGCGKIDIIGSIIPRFRKIQIEITDNGAGIKEENLDKIFDPFFTTKDVGLGTGLGLAVVYGVIVEHGGNIVVTSKYHEGTNVTFTLPIEEE
jgi:signal transduction histidine kinase/ActR/RegA family two-component response regulator